MPLLPARQWLLVCKLLACEPCALALEDTLAVVVLHPPAPHMPRAFLWRLYGLRDMPVEAPDNYHAAAAATSGSVICAEFLLVHDLAARATFVLHGGLVHTG